MNATRQARRSHFFQKWTNWILLGLFVLVFLLSFGVGRYPVSPKEVVLTLLSKPLGRDFGLDPKLYNVVVLIRLPRILAAALIGAGLSAAGAAYQGLFRNPMVSPDVLGASSGAGLGAAISLLFSLNYFFVTLHSFVLALLSVLVVYLISLKAKQDQVLGLVLSGMLVSSLLSSGISFVKLVADPSNTLPAITYWLMGSLVSIRYEELRFAAVPVGLGMGVLLLLRWKMNILTMGEDEARSLGVNTRVMRVVVILASTIITAACVAISGMIGWIGLLIPHFARMLVGYDYGKMMPTSILLGATFLMVVDSLARVLTTAEIPIGILTSFLGAPFFIYLIWKRGQRI